MNKKQPGPIYKPSPFRKSVYAGGLFLEISIKEQAIIEGKSSLVADLEELDKADHKETLQGYLSPVLLFFQQLVD